MQEATHFTFLTYLFFLFSLTLHLLSYESPSLRTREQRNWLFLAIVREALSNRVLHRNITHRMLHDTSFQKVTQSNFLLREMIYISSHMWLFNAHKVYQHFYTTADCLLSIYILAQSHTAFVSSFLHWNNINPESGLFRKCVYNIWWKTQYNYEMKTQKGRNNTNDRNQKNKNKKKLF